MCVVWDPDSRLAVQEPHSHHLLSLLQVLIIHPVHRLPDKLEGRTREFMRGVMKVQGLGLLLDQKRHAAVSLFNHPLCCGTMIDHAVFIPPLLYGSFSKNAFLISLRINLP